MPTSTSVHIFHFTNKTTFHLSVNEFIQGHKIISNKAQMKLHVFLCQGFFSLFRTALLYNNSMDEEYSQSIKTRTLCQYNPVEYVNVAFCLFNFFVNFMSLQ